MRKHWDWYFQSVAQVVAERATCDRAHVGCVIVKDKRILSTGYNGSIAGTPHCDDEGHDIVEGHCVRTVHAEINAITQAAKHGTSIDGATAYITHYPCLNCFKALANSGITEIIYNERYGVNPKVEEYANDKIIIKGNGEANE